MEVGDMDLGEETEEDDDVYDEEDEEAELRIDPSDGQPYSQQSFLEVYGGLDEWKAAKPAAAWWADRM